MFIKQKFLLSSSFLIFLFVLGVFWFNYPFDIQEDPVKLSTAKDPVTGMQFVLVKGGCYQMGDLFNEGDKNERPVHDVCVDDFFMGRYEATQEQWHKVMGYNPSRNKDGKNLPVEWVSWCEIQNFITRLNRLSRKRYRLPTEAQWEYAARQGGKKIRFGFGKNRISPKDSNFACDERFKEAYSTTQKSLARTVAVGSYPANVLGLYDMTGNVDEWCADWYSFDYYAVGRSCNPDGASKGDISYGGHRFRAVRGGAWNASPFIQRVSRRQRAPENERRKFRGFRLVFSPADSKALRCTDLHSLTIHVTPAHAQIKILNSDKPYKPAMKLNPGRYQVEVSLDAYTPDVRWLDLRNQDVTCDIELDLAPQKPLMPKRETFTDPVTGMQFILVKGGCFKMTETQDTDLCVDQPKKEEESNQVCVDDFYLGKYEVTREQWQKIVGSTPSKTSGEGRFPVVQVSWEEIVHNFIPAFNRKARLQSRLPMIKEWEYAAREGGKSLRFGTGKETLGPDEANFDGSPVFKERYSRSGLYRKKILAAGSFSPNALGFHDMSGNVAEWCLDQIQTPLDVCLNDRGEAPKAIYAYKGGSWHDPPAQLRTRAQGTAEPDFKNSELGFRLAFSCPEAEKEVESKVVFTDPVTGMEFVHVPGGCYTMGDAGEAYYHTPHKVCVDDFYMGRYEVTQDQWQKVVYSNPSKNKQDGHLPVEQVRYDTIANWFLPRLNERSHMPYQLPTEAQWEYAARQGGKDVRYGTGQNEISAATANIRRKDQGYSNETPKIYEGTVGVGSYGPNSLGLYDMSGNVAEFCADYYHYNYYEQSPVHNPAGPPKGSERVVRGGSWKSDPKNNKASYRYRSGGHACCDIGFRLVFSGISADKFKKKESLPEATLTITTRPEQADIQLVQYEKKYQPGITLPADTYLIKISSPGYQTKTQWLKLQGGQNHKAHIALNKLEPLNPVPKRWTEPVTGMTFVHVPKGCFAMGGHGTADQPDALPEHQVCLDDFWMGTHEVSAGQYRAYILASGNNKGIYWAQAPINNDDNFSLKETKSGADTPMTGVDWHAAASMGQWLAQKSGKAITLPSEAQWEYAARNAGRLLPGDGPAKSGTETLVQQTDNTGIQQSQTEQIHANALELFNLETEPGEWCSDWYRYGYYKDFFAARPFKNPFGPDQGRFRVHRGSRHSLGKDSRTGAWQSYRSSEYPGKADDIGFRLVFSQNADLPLQRLSIPRANLTVNTDPAGAKIEMLDTNKQYHPGMALQPSDSYLLKVSAPGYGTEIRKFFLDSAKDYTFKIILRKNRPQKSFKNIYTDPTTGMQFIYIPGGRYPLCCDCHSDQKLKEVAVQGFWMSRFEVTNGQYRMFAPEHCSGSSHDKSLDDDNQPVVMVTRGQALAFINWLNNNNRQTFRLPTEEEWEYAGRGGLTTVGCCQVIMPELRVKESWPARDIDMPCGGENIADLSADSHGVTWHVYNCDDGYVVSAPVGSFRPNAYGIHDILGNVREWCADQRGPWSDPCQPDRSASKDRSVLRGFSWKEGDPKDINNGLSIVSERFCAESDAEYDDTGFRLVFSGPPPEKL